MTHGSLFSGIGGFDLAAEWMGWENVFHCEWNEFGQKVLKYYWPKAISYYDITKTDFTIHRGRIDLLSGGFPCQPYSMAGKRKGKEDERHLWPEMRRAIKEIQPRWVVGENVYGLVNWSGGLVFHEVQTDLEAAGYEVFPYVLPAAAVNAPHRRDRVWFVAYARCNRERERSCKDIRPKRIQPKQQNINNMGIEGANAPHPNSTRIHQQYNSEIANKTEKFSRSDIKGNREGVIEYANSIGQERRMHENKSETTNGQQFGKSNSWNHKPTYWKNFPSQSPLCFRDDGISSRLDNITFSKWKNESIKAAGNAIVPQVALQIFKAIQEYENITNKT